MPRCRWRYSTAATVAIATVALCRASAVSAQLHEPARGATTAEVIGGNILIGGLIAASRALFTDADPLRAFARGAFGGGIYVAGKNLTVEPGAAKAWLGHLVASTGTSMVSNAGRGERMLGEIRIPLASVRIRVTPFDEAKVRFAVNLFETAIIVRHAVRDGLELDWRESVSRGALMFIARDKRVFFGDEEVAGFALAPTTVVSSFARDLDSVFRHEMVHVHQQWFLQETVGRPLEATIRNRTRFLRLMPRWLEIGVVGPGILLLDDHVFGGRGLGNALEAEAELLERR